MINEFWDIIHRAKGSLSPDSESLSPDELASVLEAYPTDDIYEFALAFNQMLVQLNKWDIWGAGFVICDGMDEDSFHYFRSWIIGKGRKCFETALRSPDDLIDFLGSEQEFENEQLEYVALDILEARGILDDPREEGEDADTEPDGEPFDEETVDDQFPRLAALYEE